jgi:hypothetical protein
MKLEDKFLYKKSYLCSLHFKEKFIDRTSLACVRLRKNAIPYVSTFPTNISYIKKIR